MAPAPFLDYHQLTVTDSTQPRIIGGTLHELLRTGGRYYFESCISQTLRGSRLRLFDSEFIRVGRWEREGTRSKKMMTSMLSTYLAVWLAAERISHLLERHVPGISSTPKPSNHA